MAARVSSGFDAGLVACRRTIVRGGSFGPGDVEAATRVVSW